MESSARFGRFISSAAAALTIDFSLLARLVRRELPRRSMAVDLPGRAASTVTPGSGRADDWAQAAQPAGAGRAPEGLCGAAYAARLLAPDRAEELEAAFAAGVGSLYCKEIRAAKEHSCAECVAEAAELLAAARNDADIGAMGTDPQWRRNPDHCE